MPAHWPLGNDIVDLRLAENEKSAANPKFVERVLAPPERHAYSQNGSDGRILWAYWAAKEAAYKALRKVDPELVFAHRRFVVHQKNTTALHGTHGSAQGTVMHEARRVPVIWVWNDDWLHCLTKDGPSEPDYRVCSLSQFRPGKSFVATRESRSLSDASVAVRQLASELLHELGVPGAQIVRPSASRRRGPPQVLQHGEPRTDIDISLSHDGRYAAAAVRTMGHA